MWGKVPSGGWSRTRCPTGRPSGASVHGTGAIAMEQRLPADAVDSLSRRQFLAGSLAGGLTAAGLAGQAVPAETKSPKVLRPAKRVIFVLMSGGPSQLETFDPKPGRPTGGPF